MVISSFNVVLEKGIKKAKTQLDSGPLFKVDHWLGRDPGKSPKKAKTQLASGPLFKVDHWLGQKPRKRHQKG